MDVERLYTTRPVAETAQARRGNAAVARQGAGMTIALLAALVLQATPETLADLERAYDETCNSRVYGQYDDMCLAMATQVKSYRAELKHRPRPPKAAAPPPAAAAPIPPVEPPASHEPLAPAAPKG